MAQQSQVGSHKTTIYTNEHNETLVIYHNTAVVTFSNQHIILKTGGYLTSTTKTRMNQASRQFNLGYQVYQKDFEWFVKFGQFTYSFKNGVCILDRAKRDNDYAQLDSIV